MARRGGAIGRIADDVIEKFFKRAKRRTPNTPATPNAPHTPSTPNAPTISPRISRQKQGRHVKGDPNYQNGGYFNDHAEAQQVMDAFQNGDAQVIRTMPNGNVLIRYDGVTGYNNNPGAGYIDQETNIFMIKGSSSPSVVPYNPAVK